MQQRCFGPAEILLPEQQIPLNQWACVACDQFTSQPEYWKQVKSLVGQQPSTLDLILPEAFLGTEQENEYIEAIHANMHKALNTVLTRTVNGFVYLERTTHSGVRQGLVGAVDLEAYSYDPNERMPIRASEETVLERIPPRQAVRRGASLETPHVMMLADDPDCTVIEPVAAHKQKLRQLYDGELMMDGGHLSGWAVEDPALVEQVCAAVETLGSQEQFDRRYPEAAGQPPITLMVGDGNHSLAAAKACWEEIKQSLTPEQYSSHPARYCLVEVCNLHSPALRVEPIHRVLFGGNAASVLLCLAEYMDYHGASISAGANAVLCRQQLDLVLPCRDVQIGMDRTWHPLTVGTVDGFIDSYRKDHPGVRIDYIHGNETARHLAKNGGVGFILPALEKQDLFRGVVLSGALPCKTFSMGHAEEKRYYNECRKIIG